MRKRSFIVEQFVEVVDQEDFVGGHVLLEHTVQSVEHARDLHLVRESVGLHRLLGAAAAHLSVPARVCKSATENSSFVT
jgi:hypothetical protein